jgi:hypothetical protein
VKQLFPGAIALASASAIALHAQQSAIPVVPLGPIEAKGAEVVTTGGPLRAMSTGAVLVHDVTRRRLLRFEPSLDAFAVVIDSAAMNTGQLSALSHGLIPFAGDSTLFLEMASQSFLVLGPDGKTARVIAAPKAGDIMFMGGNIAFGATPAFDSRGRLVYRGNYPTGTMTMGADGRITPPMQPDSAPVVRADFDTRAVDTIAVMKIPLQGRMLSMAQAPGAAGGGSIKLELYPILAGDEWAMLSDGTVAIVRTTDYHIDWIDGDGTKRSTPKMPFEWRRVTDEEKQKKIDSTRAFFDSTMKAQTPNLPPGVRMPAVEITFPPLSQLPDYYPPIRPGSVRADRDGNLWILPTTSSAAGAGLVYDIVNRQGQLFRRVQLPPQTSLAGFAPGGVVYIYRHTDPSGTKATLERARVSLD